MSVVALARRVRKVEARRYGGKGAPMFLVWARTPEELVKTGETIRPRIRAGQLVGAVWPFDDEPMPDPRWTSERELSDRELVALLRHAKEELGETTGSLDPMLAGVSDAELERMILASPEFAIPERRS